jgi:hypothetical protein
MDVMCTIPVDLIAVITNRCHSLLTAVSLVRVIAAVVDEVALKVSGNARVVVALDVGWRTHISFCKREIVQRYQLVIIR